MKTLSLILSAAFCLASASSAAAKPPTYPSHQDLLYYLDKAGQRQPVRKPADWITRRQHVLGHMQLVMGQLPSGKSRVPLSIKASGKVSFRGLTRIRLTFQSDRTDRVTAFLFRPQRLSKDERRPAILCLHQTARRSGKEEPAGLAGQATMHYGIELARRGYVVFIPDYPGMGEHRYDFAKNKQYASGTMKAIWDNIRAVDYLQSLPYVDRTRIAVVGHSLGGHNAMFTAAFDRRLAVIVSSCGFTRFHKDDPPSWTAPTYMPRIAQVYSNDADKIPFDFTEVVGAFAPRPFLAIAAIHDHDFDVSGVKDTIRVARPVYKLYGKQQNLAAHYPATRHGFSDAAREQAYKFLDHHLRHKPTKWTQLRWQKTSEFTAADAIQAATADTDGKHVYAINSRVITKFNRKTQKRIASSSGPAKHLNSGIMWRGKLLCAHSNYPQKPERSEIKVLDPSTMKLTTFKNFGDYGGSLTWVLHHRGYWWCNFAKYGKSNRQTFLVQFDKRWRELKRWTYPRSVIVQLGRFSLSGGVWHQQQLLVTGHDHQEVYRLVLPGDGTVLRHIRTEKAPFTGQGIAVDPVTGGLVGISRARRQVIFAKRVRR